MTEATTIDLFDEPQQQEKRVLGLDLSIKATGYYCKGVIGHFKSIGSTRGARIDNFLNQVIHIIKENQITDVFYEFIDFVPKDELGNLDKFQLQSTYTMQALGFVLTWYCEKYLNVRCYGVTPVQWKKCLFGYFKCTGYEKKDRVQNRLRHLGYKFGTPDEADAIGVWYYGINNVERLSYGK